MKKEDIYITMLRFGKERLSGGFFMRDLMDFLYKNGHPDISLYNIFLNQYFHLIFFSKNSTTEYPPNDSILFYLRPECYMQLLEHDNIIKGNQQAKETRIYAIIAIVLTLISLVVSIWTN